MSVNRTAGDALAKFSKAEDEYPRQYPKLSGPRAGINVARIVLQILSLPVFSSDSTERERVYSRFPNSPSVDSVSAILGASKMQDYRKSTTLPCYKRRRLVMTYEIMINSGVSREFIGKIEQPRRVNSVSVSFPFHIRWN